MSMQEYREIEHFREELDKCVTCGICQSVCPSFQLTGKELLSPRGRISLLRRLLDGDIVPEQVSADTFDFCTLCYACQTACPAGVKTDLLFISARKTLAESNGIGRIKKLVFNTLEYPKRVNMAVLMGSLAQSTIGQKNVNFIAGGMSVPSLRRSPYLNKIPETIPPMGRKRARVALFLGCMSNYVSEEPARDSIEILRRLGVEVFTPKDQVCCGAPAFNNGDFETARNLAKRNLDILKEANVDAIVSPDATCGGAFNHEIPELLKDDPEYGELAREISAKTTDWTSYVVEFLDPVFPESKALPISVTIHDSCHLTHTSGKQDNVRNLIARLPGVRIVEMADSTICCGFGGSFMAAYSEESQAWSQKKIDNMVATRTQIAIASSPGCISTLRSKAEDSNSSSIRILHPAELIVERCNWQA